MMVCDTNAVTELAKTSRQPASSPGRRERQGHAEEGAPAPGPERGGGVLQVRIEPRHHADQRQQHERHLDLGERHHQPQLGVEQAQRRRHQPEADQGVVDEALAPEDDDPGEGAHHHAGQQRQHDDEEQDGLQAPRGLHEEEPERHPDARGQGHRLHPEEQGLAQHAPVEGIPRELGVLDEAPALELRRHPQADAREQRQRREEEEQEEAREGQGEPPLARPGRGGATLGYCRISLLKRSIQAARFGLICRQSWWTKLASSACDLTMSVGKSGWSGTFLFTERSP